MTRRRSAWLRDTTGHGFLVVATFCLSLLAAVVTACALALRGDELPDRFDVLLTGLLVGLPSLLAKARRDAPLEDAPPPEPVPVTLADEPVEVVAVEGPGELEPDPDLPRARSRRRAS